MIAKPPRERSRKIPAILSGVVAVGVFLAARGALDDVEPKPVRDSRGIPQLISAMPLPAEEGPMCEWKPASASTRLVAIWQEGPAARAAVARAEDRSSLKPLRTIRDPYAAYSSVAVDTVHNEVVLTDENLFQILVYDRLANTPP